jgi:hypothetical protein
MLNNSLANLLIVSVMCCILKISKVFSKTPGPALISEGRYSGQLFRETILAPFIRNVIHSKSKVIVDLDNTAGYGAAFLVNAFGGLVSIDKLDKEKVLETLEIVSEEEEYLKEDILGYIQEEG